jgi:signal transduction histidine kinase
MLKNFKVTTKLVAILVAPVLVLVALAYVGVKQRLADASEAQRVEQLTAFMQVNSTLIKEMQLEGLRSAVFSASGKLVGKDELDAQRKVTDEALKNFNASRDSVDPGRESADVRTALDTVATRIRQFPTTTRKGVDNLQTETLKLITDFLVVPTDLLRVNLRVAESVNDPALARGLNSFVNLEELTNDEARTAALIAISSQIGFYAQVLPSGTNTVPKRTDDTFAGAVGCGENAEAAKGSCLIYNDTQSANNDVSQADIKFKDSATGQQKQIQRFADAGLIYEELKRHALEDGIGHNDLKGDGQDLSPVLPDQFVPAAKDRINKLYDAQTKVLVQDTADTGSVLTLATQKATEAQQGALLFGLFTAAAILFAGMVTVSVGRAITRPLRKLTNAAYTLSTERLPALVERLRNPEEDIGESLATTLAPIDIHSKDEIGQLADSFNSIQQVTVEVAEEQSVLLRKGIGDIFINLARRNQTLLDRQIEFIDQLEANEEDPDQLDNLFKLDHLATRMRRNAESLLVLAGAEPPRRRGRPVALADVVRVAIGEVEDFARIQLLALDEATVGGNVAVDLAHLLSELMENATHFSPPDTMVEIVGHRSTAGYILSVSDQGIGMSPDQLSEANTQLARPPLVGLALSRSLGFIVIGRLAQRFMVSVKLTASPSGGVTALVTLPTELVTYEGEESSSPAEVGAPPPPVLNAPPSPAARYGSAEPDIRVVEDQPMPQPVGNYNAPPPPTYPDPAYPAADFQDPTEAIPVSDDSLLDELVEEGMGDSDEFERGLQSILSDDVAPGSPAPGVGTDYAEQPRPRPDAPMPGAFGATVADVPAYEPPAVVPQPQPQPAPVAKVVTTRPPPVITVAEQIAEASRAEAKQAELTAAGLVRRTPKNRAPEAVGSSVPAGQQPRLTSATQRSPEEVRKMLSRYRSGLNKGRGSADSEQTDS